jgi:hypothetical protein
MFETKGGSRVKKEKEVKEKKRNRNLKKEKKKTHDMHGIGSCNKENRTIPESTWFQ